MVRGAGRANGTALQGSGKRERDPTCTAARSGGARIGFSPVESARHRMGSAGSHGLVPCLNLPAAWHCRWHRSAPPIGPAPHPLTGIHKGADRSLEGSAAGMLSKRGGCRVRAGGGQTGGGDLKCAAHNRGSFLGTATAGTPCHKVAPMLTARRGPISCQLRGSAPLNAPAGVGQDAAGRQCGGRGRVQRELRPPNDRVQKAEALAK